MEELSTTNHIVLGLSSAKISIFKFFDSLYNDDGLLCSKLNGEKPVTKPKYSSSLDFLKSNYRIKIDNTQAFTTDKLKMKKRRLNFVKNKYKSHNNATISYVLPLLDNRSTKQIECKQWFSEKLIATNFIQQRVSVCCAAIYVNSIFFRSRASIVFDYGRITFQINLKEWFSTELASNFVKSITLYAKRPVIKIVLQKTKITDEISKLSSKYALADSDTFRSLPQKTIDIKDVLFAFAGQMLRKSDFEGLVNLYGADRVLWNESDSESRDVIENLLYKSAHISELIHSRGCPDWKLIFIPRVQEITRTLMPLTATQNVPPQNNLVRMQPPQQNMINLIVNCQNTSIANKFDPLPNIFHRMRNDSQQLLQNGSFQISGLNQNISVAALNQFMANGGRVSSQPMISVPVLVNVDRPIVPATVSAPIPAPAPSAIANTTPVTINNLAKPAQALTLTYIPNRNISNVFETFHYNPTPGSDVLIHGSDLFCLNFGQYLNDNIINFYLNYIRYEIMSDDQRHRTHLFNVFFNTKLQGTPANMATDSPETRHARVAKWTKRVDIFDKDFIIIPINENQHWFLAIVCFPWMAGMISYDKLLGVNGNQQTTEIPVNETLFATKDRQDRVQRLREHYGVEPSPCILLFDSLQYQSRAPNVKLIRDYLKSEWDSKRGLTDGPLVFDKNTVRGFNPQVPQQDNNIDCGIFVLHYVEQFFSQPLRLFTKEYFQSSLTQWFDTETVNKKRAAIQKMILDKADQEQSMMDVSSRNNNNNNTISNNSTSDNDVCMESVDVALVSSARDDSSGPDIQML